MRKYVWFNHATGCFELNKNVTEQYVYGYFNAIENLLEEYNIENFDELKKLLQKEIKEANPSEALRKLDIIRHLEIGFDKINGKPITLNDTSGLNIIEKALTTKSKKEQAFDLIVKKLNPLKDHYEKVLLRSIAFDYEDYLERFKHRYSGELTRLRKYKLTEEEFDILKEML